MTKSTIISLAYFVGFAAISAGTIPAWRFMLNIGMNYYLVAFLWIIAVGSFSWSLARWMTNRTHW